MLPVLLQPGRVVDFPDPGLADEEGLVAVGGDLSVERLLRAYDQGVFPWFSEDNPKLWWSPDPRAVLLPERLHVSRSMRRVFERGGFRITWDRAFPAVMRACAERRSDGTWIVPEMIAAYERLHGLGHAHSLEVWHGDDLAGGIYGVHRGGLFAAESMFHRVSNASKLALIAAVRTLAAAGVELIDVQLMTPHLRSMGAVTVSRADYLQRVRRLREKRVELLF